MFGGNISKIATLVERHASHVLLAGADSKDTEMVVDTLIFILLPDRNIAAGPLLMAGFKSPQHFKA